METERIRNEVGGIDPVLFYKQGASAPDYLSDPWVVLNALSDYRVLHEVYTPNSDWRLGTREVWKSFMHYKCIRSPVTSILAGKATWEWDFRPNHHVAWSTHPRFGVGGYTKVFGSSPTYHGPFGEPGLPIEGLPGFYIPGGPEGAFVPPPGNLAGLKAASLKTMLPTIKAELSLVNSLIELKDFKSLPLTIKKMTGLINSTRKTLKQVLQSSGDGYLQMKFNLMPLVSDIKGIFSALSRVERRINDLITRSGRLQRRHYTYHWQEFPYTLEVYPNKYSPCNPDLVLRDQDTYYTMTRTVEAEPTTFHAEIEFNYNYSQYQREHAHLLSLLDAFGVNLNPSIIWNAIPWSFLVDWVLGVSRWLDQFKVQNMEPKINITRYLWSVRRKRKIITTRVGVEGPFTVHGVPVADGWRTEVPLPETIETAYRRTVEMPTMSSLTASGLSETEITLGAALVIARRRNPRQRSR